MNEVNEQSTVYEYKVMFHDSSKGPVTHLGTDMKHNHSGGWTIIYNTNNDATYTYSTDAILGIERTRSVRLLDQMAAA